MKIARKEFVHPSGNWSKGFFWWKKGEDKGDWVAKTLSEVREEFMSFVNTLSPEMVVNICEYTTTKVRRGDDKITHFVVWYWQDEVTE